MSDYASGLPVRSEKDGVDESVIVKVTDGTNGTVNQLRIDADKNAHVEVHGNKPDGTTDVTLALTEEGRQSTRGDYDASTNTKPSSNAMIAHSRQATPTEIHQTFRGTGIASTDGSNAKALDVAIRDESGNAFTASNPLPVTFVDSEGAEVNDYKTTAAVAAAGTTTHDYTVTVATSLKLSQIIAAGSGKIKVLVQIETGAATGVFTTKFVGFNSTANPQIQIPVNENITVAAGVKVRVSITNRDLQAQDVYSTTCGHEI